MLRKFTVENYRSFKDSISIDFTQKGKFGFSTDCISNGLLSKIAIYGPNASGKSNLGYALFDIVRLLTDKHIEPLMSDKASFLNADSDKPCAKFSYEFQNGHDLIVYSYQKKGIDSLVCEELDLNGKKVYSYDFEKKEKDFKDLDLINADTLNFTFFEGNLPVMRYIANNTIQSKGSTVHFLMDFVSHMLWFRSLQENGYIGLDTKVENIENWIIDNNNVNDFSTFLASIAGINKELISATIPGTNEKALLEKRNRRPLVFPAVSSSGTKALELFYYWSKRFHEVSFLYMDEFDAFYHHDLAERVINMVKQFNNLQAIFTTHNTFLLNNTILRPDCYFTLDNGKLVSFVNSTDRELREGLNLEKLYRNGEFDTTGICDC